MSGFQKLIKYIAIAFAIYLIFNIISILIGGVSILSGVLSNDVTGNLNKIKVDDSYKVLDIELESINILIKEGKKFKVETDSDNVSLKEVGDKLLITNKKENWKPKKVDSDIVIYVPNSYVFDYVIIENGAGRIDIDYINTKELELDLGAGKVDINKLIVSKEASIEGGAGEIIINDGIINNLEFDMGLGKVYTKAKLVGDSEINAGIGEVEIDLVGNISDYSMNISKGIGSVKIAGEDVKSGNLGTGSNFIDINGGIGTIDIDFK